MHHRPANGRNPSEYRHRAALYRRTLVWVLAGLTSSALAGEFCQSFPCSIIGTESSDILYGTDGDDVMCGLGGKDEIFGMGGNDLICGGDGNDILVGGSGLDRLRGEKGKDLLLGDDGDDELDGGPGNDTLSGGAGRDFLIGGMGRDDFEDTSPEDTCEADPSENLNHCSTAEQASAFSGRPFSTMGRHILDPKGETFVPNGINIFPWHRSPATLSAITDCWQFNLVRLHAWIFDDSSTQWKDHLVYVESPLIFDAAHTSLTTYDVKPLIDALTSKEIVVVFDVHEHIGSFFEGQELEDYLVFIRDFAMRYAQNPYVWLDIHNEPGAYEGQQSDFSKWRNEVETIVSEVRAIAPNMMILVPGMAWGQDTGPNWSDNPVRTEQSALLANPDLLHRYDNIIGTFHLYDQWIYGTERLRDYVSRLYATLNIPVLVGEYGSSNNVSTLNATRSLHTLTGEAEYSSLGRTAWVWDAYDQNDLTTDGNGGGQLVDSCIAPSNLTELGTLIWKDNHEL